MSSLRAVLMTSGGGDADCFMMRCILCSGAQEAEGLIAPSASSAGEPGRRAFILLW